MMKKRTLWVAALVLLLALVLASCGSGQGGGGGGGSQTTAGKKATTAHTHNNKTTTETTTAHKKAPPAGVTKSYSNLSRNHTKEPVDYSQSPPVGGAHNPVWQNCGYYDQPVRDENAVHSLEHGAVWITYSPDLPKDQVETLRDIAQSNSYVLVTPYSDLPSQVVASAWGKQLHLNSADDPRLEQFVSAYQQGPQNPEPGAPCSGGVGSPE
jgi:predicted small secreted protein